MLNILRKNRKTITGILIAGFCAILMVGFGVDSFYHQPQSGPIATVDGQEISYREFTRRQENITRQLQSRLGESYHLFADQLNVKQQALDSLISEYLLEKFTDSMDLTASTAQIQNKILESPYFEGKYSKRAFQGYLGAIGMTAAQLEGAMKQEIVRAQLASTLAMLTYMSEEELRAQFDDENAAIQLRYLAIPSKNFADKVDTSDQEKIAAFYDSVKETYRTPRQVQFSAVAFNPENYVSQVAISEDDLQVEYRERISEFSESPQLHLRHIVLNKPSKLEEALVGSAASTGEQSQLTTADPVETKRQQAQSLHARLEAGEDFSKLASEFSEVDNDKAGDMGWVSYDKLPESLSKAASDLDVLEYSNVIETDHSFEIIFVEEAKPRREKEFAEVKEQLEKELRHNDAPLYARIAADEFMSKWDKADNSRELPLSDFAASEKVAVISSNGFVSQGSGAAGLPPALVEKVLELNPGDRETTEVDNTSYVVSVQDVKEPSIPPLEEVRDKVVAAYVAEESRKLAQIFADELVSGSPHSLAETAKGRNLEIKETELVKKADASKEPFVAPGLREVAFRLRKEQPVASRSFRLGDTIYVIELAKRELPSEQEFRDRLKSTVSAEQQQAGSRLMEALLEVLRAQADIWINPDLFEQV